MSNFKEVFLEIYRKHKGLLFMMVILFLFSFFVFVYSVIAIDPNSAVVRIGYGDVGGYRDGSWVNMLVFPILSVVFGVLHNFLAMKIFEKQGEGITKLFVSVSLGLVIMMFIVLLRLLGES